jgi:hypothetical protein
MAISMTLRLGRRRYDSIVMPKTIKFETAETNHSVRHRSSEAFMGGISPNAPDQAGRANDVQLSTET